MTSELLDKYETPNMTLAATLYSMNISLSHVSLSGRNGTMGIFHFDNVPNTVLHQFDQGTLRIEPQIFHMMIKRLSSMVKGVVRG